MKGRRKKATCETQKRKAQEKRRKEGQIIKRIKLERIENEKNE
jgi:hypothetical protein